MLTPLVERDADAMFQVLDDPQMHEFTGGAPLTLDELRERYRWLAAGRSPDGSELWFNWIVRLPDDAPVGVVQATVAPDGTTADAAWEIGVPWQGHGYASEAAVGMVEWLVAHDVGEVRAMVHPDHAASAAVAARAGLQPTDERVDGEVVWRLRPGEQR